MDRACSLVPNRTVLLAVFCLISTALAFGQKYASLYDFQGGSDGWQPSGSLIADKSGNLYGTTVYGGNSSGECIGNGCGTIFELTPPTKQGDPWTKTTLHEFSFTDGASPSSGGLALDQTGNLYGTTNYGGTSGYGVVYELSPPALAGGSSTLTVIYNFTDGDDGGVPSGVVTDAAGNLYGTTNDGGQYGQQGVGTIFELSPPQVQGDPWIETTLQSFRMIKDGDEPNGVTLNSKGNLFGTRTADNITCTPAHPKHCGTAFELVREGTNSQLKVLYQFQGSSDGASPGSNLISDATGNRYGTTTGFPAILQTQGGTTFELSPPAGGTGPWAETTLYTFSGSSDGGYPGDVLFDEKGNLYGTTFYGGDLGCNLGAGCGVVFKLAPPSQPGQLWSETVLHSFGETSADGQDPGSLIWGQGGFLYGTASGGGGSSACNGGCGTVFRIAP
jgi:uncharacterized repeat protein (TIGR03803 family)